MAHKNYISLFNNNSNFTWGFFKHQFTDPFFKIIFGETCRTKGIIDTLRIAQDGLYLTPFSGLLQGKTLKIYIPRRGGSVPPKFIHLYTSTGVIFSRLIILFADHAHASLCTSCYCL